MHRPSAPFGQAQATLSTQLRKLYLTMGEYLHKERSLLLRCSLLGVDVLNLEACRVPVTRGFNLFTRCLSVPHIACELKA